MDEPRFYILDNFLRTLQNNVTDCLKGTEEISCRDIEVCHKYRRTLTHLDITFTTKMMHDFGDTLMALHQFTRLTHLQLIDIDDSNVSFIEILDICSNLISFKYDNCAQPNEDYVTSTTDQIKMKSQRAAPGRYLQVLEIDVPKLSKLCTEFLFNHLDASSLNRVRILMHQSGLDE